MVQGQLQPGLRLVAEVRQGHRHGDVDGGEQPEEDDGEEAADGEDDEGGPAVHDGSQEEQQAEEGEDPEDSHGDGPPQSLDLLDTEGEQEELLELLANSSNINFT